MSSRREREGERVPPRRLEPFVRKGMATLTQLSSVEKKRVARLVQQLLDAGREHSITKAKWAVESAQLRASASWESARRCAEVAALSAACCRHAATLAARRDELSAQNFEVVAETVELRAKLGKALKLVKGYQLQMLDLGRAQDDKPSSPPKQKPVIPEKCCRPEDEEEEPRPPPRRAHEEKAPSVDVYFSSQEESSSSESEDETGGRGCRTGLARRALRLAYEGEICQAEPTPSDLEVAVKAKADVSASASAADDEEEVRIASRLIKAMKLESSTAHNVLEMGMGEGRWCLAVFVLKPKGVKVVRGVELCASRFAVAERALRRLATASRAERSRRDRSQSRLLPRVELAAASAGLVRLKGRNGRVLEFRRGDFFDVPTKTLQETDVLALTAVVPKPRHFPDLANLLAALPPNATIASIRSLPVKDKIVTHLLDPTSSLPVIAPRLPGGTPVYLYTRSRSALPQRKQRRASTTLRRPPAEVFQSGDFVVVTDKYRQDRHGRVLAQDSRDHSLTVLYSDGSVDESVSLSHCHTPRTSAETSKKTKLQQNPDADDDISFLLNSSKLLEPQPRLASSQWVSVWDDQPPR